MQHYCVKRGEGEGDFSLKVSLCVCVSVFPMEKGGLGNNVFSIGVNLISMHSYVR